MRKATNIARENLVSLGTCIGKFTKTRRFRLHITALDFMAPYAKVLFHPMYILVVIKDYESAFNAVTLIQIP